MSAADAFERSLEEAESLGRYEEAAGWARMRSLVDLGDPQWTAIVGLMLVKAADRHREDGSPLPAARASRQARQVMEKFEYPSGNETVDGVIELAESIYAESCRVLGSAPPGFREEIAPNMVGEWINALDGFETRRIDWGRLADMAEAGE